MAYNYYKILELQPTATRDDIKVAYRKQAKRFHPDVCDSPRSHEMQALLNDSYQILTDPEKRRQYDELLGFVEVVAHARHRNHGPNMRFRDEKYRKYRQSTNSYARSPVAADMPKLAVRFLFVYGVFFGSFLCVFTIVLVVANTWPLWMSWLAGAGLVLMADGMKGLRSSKGSFLLRLRDKLRSIINR